MANTKAIGVAFADPAFDSVQVGSSGVPISITSAGVLNGAYATTSATSGDTRLSYNKLTFTSTAFGADPEAVRCVAVADTPFAYKHLLYRSYCSGCTNKENEIIRSISISSEFTCANTRSKLGFPPHDWDNDFSRVHQCRRRGTHLSVRNAAHASIIRVVVIYVIEKLTGQLIDG
jgi:hypothetical protein